VVLLFDHQAIGVVLIMTDGVCKFRADLQLTLKLQSNVT